ncbi:MAG: transcriptional regulator [Christensenellaceae bacterium]
MVFDYKKEYKEFYLPPKTPELIDIPSMNFAAVRGKGNPNEEDGEYKSSIGLLYGIAFTIKMSRLGSRKIEGYFEYVVPPLEGLWWQKGVSGIDYSKKETFEWISMIRLPDFVTKEDFDWAVAKRRKRKASIFGDGVLLIGRALRECIRGALRRRARHDRKNGRLRGGAGIRRRYRSLRFHHEIYLGDPARCDKQT